MSVYKNVYYFVRFSAYYLIPYHIVPIYAYIEIVHLCTKKNFVLFYEDIAAFTIDFFRRNNAYIIQKVIKLFMCGNL